MIALNSLKKFVLEGSQTKLIAYTVYAVIFCLCGCHVQIRAASPQDQTQKSSRQRVKSLEKRLSTIDLDRLVGYVFEPKLYDSLVVSHGDNDSTLAIIVMDQSANEIARFAALDFIYQTSDTVYNRLPKELKASIYVNALDHHLIKCGDYWGGLWEGNSEGFVGYNIIQLGVAAVPYLVELLDDRRLRSGYSGSEEATMMNRLGYRIKDFAAYYISKIHNYELAYFPEFKDRDTAIALMRKALGI